jgi:Ca2+-binding RTX toxin-like protein
VNGSLGQDIMTGNTGNDIFSFTPGRAVPIDVAAGTVDTITDFTNGDLLQSAAGISNFGRAIPSVGSSDVNGVVTFNTPPVSLQQAVLARAQNLPALITMNVIFQIASRLAVASVSVISGLVNCGRSGCCQ